MAFNTGQRVVFLDEERGHAAWFHAASMSLDGVVMHLNARDERGNIKPITGRVLKIIIDAQGITHIDFRPDGWLTPETMWPGGFQMTANYFKPYPEDAPEMPGTITGNDGMAVSNEKIAEEVEKRIRKAEGVV